MSDIAQLGIAVRETGTKDAAEKLTVLAGAAARAEAETQGLTRAHAGATGAAMAAAKAYAGANDNSARLAASSKNSSYQLRMMALQFSQVAQQAQAGGGILRALAIQLPDLTTGFGPLGIAAGIAAGAMLSYYAAVSESSTPATLTLEQQRDLIQRVADTWGSAYPALKAYADQLERARNESELAAAQQAATSKTYKDLSGTLELLAKQAPEVSRAFRDITSPDGVQAVQTYLTAMNDLRTAITNGKNPTEELGKATNAFATILSSTASDKVRSYGELLDVLAEKIRAAAQADLKFRMQLPDLGTLGDMWAEDGQFFNSEQFQVANPPTPGVRPNREDRPKARASGAADAYKSALLSTQERTKSLQAQISAQAALNPLVNDYDFALTKAKTSADLLSAAEKAKKAITPSLIAQIDETSTALANATAEQGRLTEATNRYKANVEFLKSTTAGFLNDFRNGLRSGESMWESFGNAALNVLDRITDKLLNDVLDAVFKVSSSSGSGGGGVLDGIFGSLFGGSSSSFPSKPGIGLYAAGTPAARPGLAWVGEKGPELVRFKGGEEVIPNHRVVSAANQNPSSMQPRQGDVGVKVDVGVKMDNDGNLQAYVKNVANQQTAQTVGRWAGSKEFARAVGGALPEVNTRRLGR